MKKPAKIIFFALFAAAVAAAVFFGITQAAKKGQLNDIYNTQIKGRKIVSVEYVKYEKEPFMSVVKQRRYTDSASSEAFRTIKSANTHGIKLMPLSSSSSEVLLVKFKDGSLLTSYIKGNTLGLDSGRVWIKGIDRKKMIKEMKKVKLVKNVN